MLTYSIYILIYIIQGIVPASQQECKSNTQLPNFLQVAKRLQINSQTLNGTNLQYKFSYTASFFDKKPTVTTSINKFGCLQYTQVDYQIVAQISDNNQILVLFVSNNMRWMDIGIIMWLNARADIFSGTVFANNIQPALVVPITFNKTRPIPFFSANQTIYLNFINSLSAQSSVNDYSVNTSYSSKTQTTYTISISTGPRTSVRYIKIDYIVYNLNYSTFASVGGIFSISNLLNQNPYYVKIHKNFAPINYYLLGFDMIKLVNQESFMLNIQIDQDFILQTTTGKKIDYINIVYITVGTLMTQVCNKCPNSNTVTYYAFGDKCLTSCPPNTYPFDKYSLKGASCLTCSNKLHETLNKQRIGCLCQSGYTRNNMEICLSLNQVKSLASANSTNTNPINSAVANRNNSINLVQGNSLNANNNVNSLVNTTKTIVTNTTTTLIMNVLNNNPTLVSNSSATVIQNLNNGTLANFINTTTTSVAKNITTISQIPIISPPTTPLAQQINNLIPPTTPAVGTPIAAISAKADKQVLGDPSPITAINTTNTTSSTITNTTINSTTNRTNIINNAFKRLNNTIKKAENNISANVTAKTSPNQPIPKYQFSSIKQAQALLNTNTASMLGSTVSLTQALSPQQIGVCQQHAVFNPATNKCQCDKNSIPLIKPGQTIDNYKECYLCDSGTFKDGIQCKGCPWNCLVCTSETSCQKCHQNTVYVPEMVSCMQIPIGAQAPQAGFESTPQAVHSNNTQHLQNNTNQPGFDAFGNNNFGGFGNENFGGFGNENFGGFGNENFGGFSSNGFDSGSSNNGNNTGFAGFGPLPDQGFGSNNNQGFSSSNNNFQSTPTSPVSPSAPAAPVVISTVTTNTTTVNKTIIISPNNSSAVPSQPVIDPTTANNTPNSLQCNLPHQIIIDGRCQCDSETVDVGDGSCVRCPETLFRVVMSDFATCQSCIASCVICTDGTSCLQCEPSYTFDISIKQCIQSSTLNPPQPQAAINTTIQNCKQNEELLNGVCTCANNSIKINQQCVLCSPKTIKVFDTVKNHEYCQQCYTLIPSCIDCSSPTNCTFCIQNFTIQNGNCVCNPPYNIIGFLCSECPPNTVYNNTIKDCQVPMIITNTTQTKVNVTNTTTIQTPDAGTTTIINKTVTTVTNTTTLVVPVPIPVPPVPVPTCKPNQILDQNICKCNNISINVSGLCFVCDNGSYKFNQVTCQRCIPNCLSCKSNNTCQQCQPNFNFNPNTNLCELQCPPNQININGFCQCKEGQVRNFQQICQSCPPGFYYNVFQCDKCPEKCTKCSASFNQLGVIQCTQCALPYLFDAFTKSCCLINEVYNKALSKCQCIPTFVNISGKCGICPQGLNYIQLTQQCRPRTIIVPPTPPAPPVISINTTKITTNTTTVTVVPVVVPTPTVPICRQNQFLVNNVCICANNTIRNTSSGLCENCPFGQYYQNNKCNSCAIRCLDCRNKTQCQKCEEGYTGLNCQICAPKYQPIGPSLCQRAPCGNGVKDQKQQCDDGNIISGDGCTSKCILQNGYGCEGRGGCVKILQKQSQAITSTGIITKYRYVDPQYASNINFNSLDIVRGPKASFVRVLKPQNDPLSLRTFLDYCGLLPEQNVISEVTTMSSKGMVRFTSEYNLLERKVMPRNTKLSSIKEDQFLN